MLSSDLQTSYTAKNKVVVIALDAMGGDNAPESVIGGASLIAEDKAKFPDIFFNIYGNKNKIQKLLDSYPDLKASSQIIHCEQVIPADEKVSGAIRNYKDSSMSLAINAVKDKQAHAMVSAGNTAALMAISTLTLRTLDKIHRPAIVTTLPTLNGKVTMLDLGANAACNAENLYQFAIMGQAFAKIILNIDSPKIGLVNIGAEETKGVDSIKLAKTMIEASPIAKNFYGYVEGNDIANGVVDVVVADGFTGNVVLKAIAGYAKVYKSIIEKTITKSLFRKLKYKFFFQNEFKEMAQGLDNRHYNGAMLIGLNGVIVKSHGHMDEVGLASAIKVAYSLSKFDVNKEILEELQAMQPETYYA